MPFLCFKKKAIDKMVIDPSARPEVRQVQPVVQENPEVFVKPEVTKGPRDEIKLNSAVSKNSKDSGFENEEIQDSSSEIESVGNIENNFITEKSAPSELETVLNETRPTTPEFCLTGQSVKEVPGKDFN